MDGRWARFRRALSPADLAGWFLAARGDPSPNFGGGVFARMG